VATFADMVSLLVTFFILLMSFSSMEKEQFAKMAGSMAGAFGVIADPNTPNNQSLTDPPPRADNRVPLDGLRTSRSDLDRIQEQAKTLVRTEAGNFINLEQTRLGLRVRITTDASFAAGSSTLSADAEYVLREIADLLRIHTHPFQVVGHAWQEGVPEDPDHADRISRERAIAAAEYLVQRGRVPANRISVSARGDLEPLRTDATTAAARVNRRLEIILYGGN
jgi:chemotaxis protein MotB